MAHAFFLDGFNPRPVRLDNFLHPKYKKGRLEGRCKNTGTPTKMFDVREVSWASSLFLENITFAIVTTSTWRSFCMFIISLLKKSLHRPSTVHSLFSFRDSKLRVVRHFTCDSSERPPGGCRELSIAEAKNT